MPIIKFTASDMMQTKVIPAGIYPSEVTKINGPVKSGSGKSYHYYFDITITEGQYKGKTRTISFNSETKGNATQLGEMQYFPMPTMATDLDFAITGVDHGIKDYELNTDDLLNKPFDAAWGVNSVDGHLTNIIVGFHPKGYGAEGPAF